MLPDVRPHRETLRPHPLSKSAESGNRVDAGIVPLFALHMAHLQHKHLGAAHFHAVYNVRYFHKAHSAFNRAVRLTCKCPVKMRTLFEGVNQRMKFATRTIVYTTMRRPPANPAEYVNTRTKGSRGAIIPRCWTIW